MARPSESVRRLALATRIAHELFTGDMGERGERLKLADEEDSTVRVWREPEMIAVIAAHLGVPQRRPKRSRR